MHVRLIHFAEIAVVIFKIASDDHAVFRFLWEKDIIFQRMNLNLVSAPTGFL